MRYFVIYQGQDNGVDYEWILSDLGGERNKREAERAISWQREGGFFGYAYICTPVTKKRGAFKVQEIHNVGNLNNPDKVRRYWVGDEIRPVRAIYTEKAWNEMLNRFWPEEEK